MIFSPAFYEHFKLLDNSHEKQKSTFIFAGHNVTGFQRLRNHEPDELGYHDLAI